PSSSRPSSSSSTRAGSDCAAISKAPASISAGSWPARRAGDGIMDTTTRRRRVFVSGQLVDYWEHPDVPFGWTHEDQQAYVDREDWVLLFNAILVPCPLPGTEHGS